MEGRIAKRSATTKRQREILPLLRCASPPRSSTTSSRPRSRSPRSQRRIVIRPRGPVAVVLPSQSHILPLPRAYHLSKSGLMAEYAAQWDDLLYGPGGGPPPGPEREPVKVGDRPASFRVVP